MARRLSSRVCGVAVVVAAGCVGERAMQTAPSGPARIEIDASSVALCGGMTEWADAEIERIQLATGLAPTSAIPLRLGARAVSDECGPAPEFGVRLGCTVGTSESVRTFAEPAAMSHEIIHGLRRQAGLWTVPFFEEGFAEGLNGSDAYPSVAILTPDDFEFDVVAATVGGDPLEGPQAYRVATHFFRFLFQRYGESSVAQFMRSGRDDGGDALLARFEMTFGEGLPEVVDVWRGDATPVQTRGRLCEQAVAPDPDGLTLEARVQCSDPGTFGLGDPDDPPRDRQCFSWPETQTVNVSLEGTAGSVVLTVDTATCTVPVGDPSRGLRRLLPGDTQSFALAGCDWAATFHAEGDAPVELTLQVRPR